MKATKFTESVVEEAALAHPRLQSPEFTGANPILSNPPSQEAYNRDYVRVLYVHALQRDPEQSGWDAWTDVLNQTGDRDIVVSGFVNSQEYASRFGEP